MPLRTKTRSHKTVTPYLNWKPIGHYIQRRTLGLMPSKTANKSPIQQAKQVPHNVSIFINSSIVWFKERNKIGMESKHQMNKSQLKVT